MLRAGFSMKDANTLAKKLTDAEIREKKDKFRASIEEKLKKYEII